MASEKPLPPICCGPFSVTQNPEEDSDTEESIKQDCIKIAAASAEKSPAISPDQLGLILLYNQVLLESAKSPGDYERRANQCRHALLIQHPIDPKNDIIVTQERTKTEDSSTKETRIRAVKLGLKNLMQDAKQALEASKEEAVEEKKGVEEEKNLDFLNLLEQGVNIRKNQELTRKRIEVDVATVADWQKQLYLGSGKVPVSDSPKKDERKRTAHSKKANKSANFSQLDKKTQVLDYWQQLSGEERSKFFVVNVDKVMEHYKKNEFASLILSKAISFGKTHHKWKHWTCLESECTGLHTDYDSWSNHVVRWWTGVLSPEENAIMPSPVDPVCANKIDNGAWTPVDVNRMLKDNKMDTDEDKWPLCKDFEREKLLKNIKGYLKLLLRNRCLSQSIVDFLIRSTRHTFETSVSELCNLIPGLDENPLCICFLGSQQLRAMLRWLLKMSHCCQFIASSEDGGFCNEINEVNKSREPITFMNNFSSLALDERLLQGEFESQNYHNFGHWLYMGDEIEQLFKSWAALLDYKIDKLHEAFQYLNSEFRHLQSLCRAKRFWLLCERTLVAIDGIFLAEDTKRMEYTGYNSQSYLSLLPLCRDELAEVAQIDSALDVGGIVLDYILNYLKNLNVNCVEIFGAAEALIQSHTQFSDMKTDEENRQRRIPTAEAYLRTAIRDKGFYVSKEKCTADALIMNSLVAGSVDQKFGLLFSQDYLPIMLHLLKSFVRTQLEEKAAEAAKDSLLSELALRPSTSSGKEDCNSRRGGENPKNQKRKDRRKAKKKTTVENKKHQPQNTENKEDSFPGKLPGHSSDSGKSKVNVEEERGGQIDCKGKELQLKGEAKQKRLAELPQHSQMATTSSYTIHTGRINVPLVSKPTDGHNMPQPPKHPNRRTHFGSSDCEVTFPTEVCPKSSKTNVPNEDELVETCNASGEKIVPNEEDEATLEASGEIMLPEIDIFHKCSALHKLEDTCNASGEKIVPNEEDEATLESPGEIVLPEIDIFYTFSASDYEFGNLELNDAENLWWGK